MVHSEHDANFFALNKQVIFFVDVLIMFGWHLFAFDFI